MSSCEIAIVLRPDYEDDQVANFVPAPRSVPTEPFTLSIIDNGKPKAKQLLGELASLLEDRFPVANVELVSKSSAGKPLEADVAQSVAARSRMVITGVGD
tara:strand:- start:56 stop:355 length:300 start_codon:yes stop_codon:yes gene_type:complete